MTITAGESQRKSFDLNYRFIAVQRGADERLWTRAQSLREPQGLTRTSAVDFAEGLRPYLSRIVRVTMVFLPGSLALRN